MKSILRAFSSNLLGSAIFGFVAGTSITLTLYQISNKKVTPQSQKETLSIPASCDNDMDFVVPTNLPESDVELFKNSLSTLIDEIVASLPTTYEMPQEAVNWVRRMLAYNVEGGKMNRGLALVDVCKTMAKARGAVLTNKERYQSVALGWCIEFLQAFFLVADDLMDSSETRRGNPCWYKLPEVGTIAINDSFILESCVYKILKKYFGREAYYGQLIDLFLEVTRQTEFGQLLDLTSQKPGEIDLSRFTIQRYKSIVRYKTAFYSFYLPVALGMILAGVSERRLFNKAREVLLIMGEYFQVQDDFLDCYGTPEQIGKIGTDIKDNKCGWLVVKALEQATPAQRQVLVDNYGRKEDRNEAAVKQLYREMNIEATFQKYEEESYRRIIALLDSTTELPQEVFSGLLKKIYKRSK